MPNHVTTVCSAKGPPESIDTFRRRMFVEKIDSGKSHLEFDFDQIIPMPACVKDVEENGIAPDVLALLFGGAAVVPAWKNLCKFDRAGKLGPWKGTAFFEKGEIEKRLEAAFPGCIANARAMARSLGETGHKSWYDWSIANWGTKWNSYRLQIDSETPLVFRFATAWSFPTPVFDALAIAYPLVEFACITIDEGYNFGCEGSFNPSPGATPFRQIEASDDLFLRVHGRMPERGEA